MMLKFKRIIGLLLSAVMVFSLTLPTFAAEIPNSPSINQNDLASSDGIFTDIDTIGNATYYVQKTDTYTIAIGFYPNLVDYAIKYSDFNSIKTAIVPIEQLSLLIPQTRSSSQSAQFEVIKEAILNGSVPLNDVTFQTSSTPPTPTTRVTTDEKEKIMNELYNEGWPSAYTNYLRASKTQNGVTAKLYHTLTYSITDYDYTLVVAKTALSVLLTLTGLPTSKLMTIVSLALTVDGVYQTVKDITIGKFDVYAYENKNVIINNTQPYWAGRTVKWTAVTGDIGAALTFDYENKHNDFDDNNAILDTGLRNCFAM